MNDVKALAQAIWGVALLLMGISVFFRIPSIMGKISTIEQFASVQFFIRFCFYLMAVLLIGGGIKKIKAFLKLKRNNNIT